MNKKLYRCVEGLVVDGPGGRIVAYGRTEAAETWVEAVGLDVLQWTDYDNYESAHRRAIDLSGSPYVRFQPVDRSRDTLDVFWIGPDRDTLDRTDPAVKKILGPHFA
jgi:hypothetical protein